MPLAPLARGSLDLGTLVIPHVSENPLRASDVAAALAEAGFSIVDMDLWTVAAAHDSVSVLLHAQRSLTGVWEFRAVHGSQVTPIFSRSLPELIHLLNESFGADAREKRGVR